MVISYLTFDFVLPACVTLTLVVLFPSAVIVMVAVRLDVDVLLSTLTSNDFSDGVTVTQVSEAETFHVPVHSTLTVTAELSDALNDNDDLSAFKKYSA